MFALVGVGHFVVVVAVVVGVWCTRAVSSSFFSSPGCGVWLQAIVRQGGWTGRAARGCAEAMGKRGCAAMNVFVGVVTVVLVEEESRKRRTTRGCGDVNVGCEVPFGELVLEGFEVSWTVVDGESPM